MDMRASINGILIHQLPKEYMNDALDQFSNVNRPFTKHDKMGLRIYFKQYRAAQESIMNKIVLVRENLYNVYSLVTNLTFHGIRPYAKEYTIKTLFDNLGSVIDLYEIQENHNDRNPLITDDYRIILDIPEVMANFDLTPLTLPGVDRQFPISFFCRLCRQNGHKQQQCLNVLSEISPSRQMSFDTSRRIDTVQRLNVVHGIDRTLKNKVPNTIPEKLKHKRKKVLEPKMNLKTIKIDKELTKCPQKNEKCESQHKTSWNRCNKVSSYSSPKHFRSESFSSRNHIRPVGQTASRMGGVSFMRKSMFRKDNESINVSKPSGESSRCYSDTHRFSKFSSYEGESADASTKECASVATDPSSGARISQSRKRIGPQISRILPPDMKVEEIYKIILKANSSGSQNLPFHIKDRLTYILHWNMENPLPNRRKLESRLLQVIRMLLNKSSRDKKEERSTGGCFNDSASSSRKDPASSAKRDLASSSKRDLASSIKCELASNIKSDMASSIKSNLASSIGERKDDQSAVSIGLSPKIRHRRTLISQGVSEVIDKVTGELKPEMLTNFLMQVRGRKNILEIVKCFTKDKDALVAQLKKVVSIYYRSGKKGNGEKQDIRCIQNLCRRLEDLKKSESSTNRDDIQQASGSYRFQDRQTFISPSIKKAIFEVNGKLKPEELFNFLVHVRGRKNFSEVVRNFTKDNNILVDQLWQVISAYYRSGQKDAVSEQNVQWIKGVCKRLSQGKGTSSSVTDLLIKTENPYDMLPKVEPTIQDVFMKSEPFFTQSFIKTEPIDE